MASVSSHNGSSHPSPYDFDSNGDTDESWQYIDYSSSASAPGSVGFLPSPASGSLNGFAIIGGHNATTSPSQHSMSPVPLPLGDGDQPFLPPATSLPMSAAMEPGEFAMTTAGEFMTDGMFMTPQEYLFAQDALSEWRQEALGLAAATSEFQMDVIPAMSHAQQQQQQQQLAAAPNLELDGFQQFHLEGTFVQWDPNAAGAESPGEGPSMSVAKYMSSPSQHSIGSSSPRSTASVKSEGSGKASPIAIRKVTAGRIGKSRVEQAGKFHIVTPNSITASAGRPNPYECFEAMRTTQRGRKGPLANATKEDALQVRRRGACFCCRSRKVKCDTERPCKHCKKLMVQVPQVVCWLFQDFLTILFPDFISAHLKKDEMVKFLRDNVDGFLIGGASQPCSVKLFSGARFVTTLDIEAKFFTAKTCDVLQHWHLNSGSNGVHLDSNGSAPIGLDLTGGSGPQRDEVRKKVKAYVRQMIEEPVFAEQVTDSLRSTRLPAKILAMAQTYAQSTDCAMVKKALSIYCIHYVMTRHLCLTSDTVRALQPSGLVPQNSPWVTPRVLARQIKSLADEICMREMQQLFELFTKALKPKYRKEWAPSLAAFLVLCLYMEAVETTTDNFVISQNAVNKKKNNAPSFRRSFALDMCREVENMPFKQFAYQFHHIYQTHSRDPNTKPFNPLFDNSFAAQSELDGPAMELVTQLQGLYQGEDWQDMQFLADDDLLLNRGDDPVSIDTAYLYTGRLVSKFLLSFMDEDRIFGGKI
ncbi:Fungal transcriptional regulatory protein [Cordyceps javanica]|uniref:Fungal transcriptional regulatory protein n=1 Tax=Cordyceps javanica TaxID=43265 RepID=A0A545W933_9HYPO|nr:Fungal transcriptional regulatory protein [Cordyceps javanica]TQW10448.1 Fungal transcriptional regulatory protein [Cordyceps javanica]